MPSKQAIIDNVAEYNSAQLAGYIRGGIVSYDELCEEPEFSAHTRKEVRDLLVNSEDSDWQNAVAIDTIEGFDRYLQCYSEGKYRNEAREAKKRLKNLSLNNEIEDKWNNLDKTDKAALETFISSYPNSSYIAEAQKHLSQISRGKYAVSSIKRLRQEIDGEGDPTAIINIIKSYLEREAISVSQLYSEIQTNPNLLSSKVIDQLEEKRVIDFIDLERNAKINPKFIEFITNNDVNSPVINIDSTPIESIGSRTTEVYFWGIPSSGKTCALGAIMSEARHGGYIEFAEPNNKCQGLHYMTILSQIFEGGTEVFKLPEGTQTDAIFEMSYVFKKQKMDYPVTFIDLAGETIDSMFRKNAKISLPPKKQAGLDTACKLLTGNSGINRKIHFFVLEYNGHTKKYKDLTQDTLLTGAMTFIKDTGIFRTETDAIYLLVTKSDLSGATSKEERDEILKKYIKKHYYQFYNGLRALCNINEINEGNVDIIPFSLGEVCFQNLCLFDNSTARTVVEVIMSRAKGFKTGKLAKILGKLKK
ncbi:MAG: hypothetical protein HDR88_03530 [Bacteroides sp.]|nr:hypothetical protein [Bacteroides sp.]